ncbi:PREDICTED: zinc finger BED domain-containing protein 1-like isoform X1 [Rhagoletis zephyria]|uniref:zinc finger BED domain-containing protein 1-like isoform X1 n=3 Tax=Rhagoletis TaxID=28609 RepID=UPI0008113FAF|nr:PREDICTED: zinc finger BED domain-containing protein 1-like isoform X1 [Rhagoletis zephyria]
MQSYVGVTIHFVKENDMVCVELGAFPANFKKDIANLKEKLREIVNNWGISDDQIIPFVTDGGSNIKGAVKQEFGESKHVTCFGHTINNIGQAIIQNNNDDAIDDDENETEGGTLKDLLKKVKKIVKFFRTSEVAAKKLRDYQKSNGQSNLKLIQEVRARWNSYFEMLERFMTLSTCIAQVILQLQMDKNTRARTPNMVTAEEVDALKEVTDILKPLHEITSELCVKKNVNISKCIPLVAGLKKATMIIEPTTAIGKIAKDVLLTEVQKRYANLEAVIIYGVATILDPRYKKAAFENSIYCSRAAAFIGNLLITSQTQSNESVESIAELQTSDEEGIWSYLDQNISNSQCNRRNVSEINSDQLRAYLIRPAVSRKLNKNPLTTWQALKNDFPLLFPIAQKYLSVMAMSVPCERLFSHAGLIATQLRNRLSPEHLNMLVFLRSIEEEMWDI